MKCLILIFALALVPFGAAGQEIIAQDSNGLVVDIRADFGHVSRETCTVVVLTHENFVLVRKDGTSAWFPLPFHSVKVVEHLKKDPDPLTNAVGVNENIAGRFHDK